MKKRGFTLIELLVVIAIIAMLLAILMPALNKVKKIAQRVVCGTNLKGLGTAQTVYANDYEDMYAKQKATGSYGPITQNWWDPSLNWSANTGNVSVSGSLYLLVREADVSPKSFVCPSSAQSPYDGKLPPAASGLASVPDITELWDFGNLAVNAGSVDSQSYAYHNPYSRFAADGTRSASFAVMADRNPWLDEKLTVGNATAENYLDVVGTSAEKWQIMRANAQPHSREGQNVLFGDGHNSFEKRSDIGVKHDNIYTIQGAATAGDQRPIRQGITPVDMSYTLDVAANQPFGSSDSYLISDFDH